MQVDQCGTFAVVAHSGHQFPGLSRTSRTLGTRLRIRYPAFDRHVFGAPPIELRNADPAEQPIEDMRSEEDHQAAFVYAGSYCLSHAQVPAPPHPNRRGPYPYRFRRRKQQEHDGVAEQGEQGHAPLLVGGAGQVRVDPALLFLVAGMTAHTPSMRHREAKHGVPAACPIGRQIAVIHGHSR